MDNDDQPKGQADLKIVRLAARPGRLPLRNWVQAVPGLPTREVLAEASLIVGCITGLAQQAMANPREVKALMRATFYLSGLAKVMIDGQLPAVRQESTRE